MSKRFNQLYPNQAIAICTRAQAERLVPHDQHVIRVNGRAGVMLTEAWLPFEQPRGPFILTSCSSMSRNICGQPRQGAQQSMPALVLVTL